MSAPNRIMFWETVQVSLDALRAKINGGREDGAAPASGARAARP